MTFLHVGLLAGGLACVAIPILIHLLMNRRRKPVRWGAMRFLVEAYRRQRKRLIVEKWVLLATRCLILALLAVALARPLLGSGPAADKSVRTVYLLIDNSLTAGLTEAGRVSLDAHKARAKEVLAELAGSGIGASGVSAAGGTAFAPGGVVVGLVALAGPAEGVVLPPSADLDGVARQIDGLELQDSRADVAGAIAMAGRDFAGVSASADATARSNANRPPPVLVVISDFLEGTLDASGDSTINADSTASIPAISKGTLPKGTTLIVSSPRDASESSTGAAGTMSNFTVVGAEPLRSVMISGSGVRSGTDARGGEGGAVDSAEQVRVNLRRSGPGIAQAATSTVRARMSRARADGEPAGAVDPSDEARGTVRWAAGQETASVWLNVPTSGVRFVGQNTVGNVAGGASGTEGTMGGAVVIARVEDDALAADNVYRRAIEVRETIRVGLIAPKRVEMTVRVDALDASSWLRLALLSAGSGKTGEADAGIEVVEIDPTGIETARLSAFDAIFLARPDLVGASGWSRLRLFAESGGVVVVTPPSGVQVHLWPDAMTRAFGLDWTVAREARNVGVATSEEPGAPADAAGMELRVTEHAGVDGADDGVGSPAAAARGATLMRVLAGELPELARTVRVQRVLEMMPTGPESRRIVQGSVLNLADGTPVLWAGGIGESSDESAPREGTIATSGSPNQSAAAGMAERGLLVYLATAIDLEWTDLPAKPLMVPLIQELVRQGVGAARGNNDGVAGKPVTPPARTTELVRAQIADDRETSAGNTVVDRITLNEQATNRIPEVRRAGIWRAIDARGSVRGLVVMNPDARAGDLAVQSRESVGRALASAVDGRGSGNDEQTEVDRSNEPGADPGSTRIVWLERGVHGEFGDSPTAPNAAESIRAALSSVMGGGVKDTGWSLPLLIGVLCLALVELVLSRWASHASVTGQPSSLTLLWRGATDITAGSAGVSESRTGASGERGAA